MAPRGFQDASKIVQDASIRLQDRPERPQDAFKPHSTSQKQLRFSNVFNFCVYQQITEMPYAPMELCKINANIVLKMDDV